MKRFHTYILYIALMIGTSLSASAVRPEAIRWHDVENDSLSITKILVEASQNRKSTPGEIATEIGKMFAGRPYKGATLEGEEEILTVNLDEFDCTTFMETVSALALCANSGHTSWQDFVNMLANLRYRKGEADGYASRLHYFSDWVITNSQRGFVREVSNSFPVTDSQIKTLDYMSRHRDTYPALTDSAVYQQIKNAEMGYRSHRSDYIKSARLGSKSALGTLKNGDIVAMVSKVSGLDVSHVGFIVIEADGPHLMHASSKAKQVIIDPLTLTEYLKKNPHIAGIRVVRLLAQ